MTPTGITLNQSSLSLEVGGTATLTATVTPSNVEDKSVQFISSNTGVATVTPVMGKVTAVSAGTATIKGITSNGKEAICNVTVTEASGGA